MNFMDEFMDDYCDSTELTSASIPVLTPMSFENAKRNLQSFANRTASDFGLSQVPSSGGLFGLGDHKVTGDELNIVISQVQSYLSKINGINIDLIREFGQVYAALESLDKEYIPAILSAIKGAEIASDQAKSAASHAKVAQEDIQKTIKEQKKIIKVLEDHKAKLDQLRHLGSVDEIWNTSQKLEQELRDFKKNLGDTQNQLSALEKSIKSLQSFSNQMLNQEHLDEIDEIWARVGYSEDKISELRIDYENRQAEIASCNKTIDDILLYINGLKTYEHLEEIDTIWMDVQNERQNINQIYEWQKASEEKINLLSKEVADQLEFKMRLAKQDHLFDIDSLWAEKIEMQKRFDSLDNKMDTAILDLVTRQNNSKEFEEELRGQIHLFEIDKAYTNSEDATEKAKKLELENGRLKEEITRLNDKVDIERENQQSQIVQIKQNIKVAYITAGVAIGFGLLDIILNILGVL
mgnify:CR=1 FL=1